MKPLIVITGASSGIGESTARQLAREGYCIALIARNEKALKKIADEIRRSGGDAHAYTADGGDAAAVAQAVTAIVAELGHPDVLINNAGAGEWRFIEETSPEQARAMMDAPFFAALHFTQALMTGMLARKSGLVIHVNSPVCELGWPGATVYMAARWALRGLHEALCLDLAGTGVRSSHVVFGKVSSNYFVSNPGSEERLPTIAGLVPLLTPDECAQVLSEVVRNPKREVVHPSRLRMFYWLHRLLPGLVRWLAVRTGRRHAGVDKNKHGECKK